MENRHINIQIGGRSYPLNAPAHQEEVLRKVGKQIQNMIKEIEQQFDIRDKQDALAMCALRLGVSAEMASQNTESIVQSSAESLKKISTMIDERRG